MGTYSVEEQRRMDCVDLTEGKRGAGYMVSIKLEEYKALKGGMQEIADRADRAIRAGVINVAGWHELDGIEKVARAALALVKENNNEPS